MRRQYEEEKERYISLIKDELNQGKLTDMERYLIQNRLFAEYNSYISDSALHYINENILIATRLNNRQWINSSILNKVHILNLSLIHIFRIDQLGINLGRKDGFVSQYFLQGFQRHPF